MRWLVATGLSLFVAAVGCAPAATVATDSPARPPAVGPPRAPLAQGQLDNGLSVLQLAEQRGWFEAGLFFAGGPLLDPVDRPGLTGWMVHSALIATEGDPDPQTPPATRALELGVMLLPVTHGNLFGWVAYGPAEAQEAALQILADVAMRPTFPPTAMQVRGARERRRIVSGGGEELGTVVAVAVGHALGFDRPVRLEATAALFDVVNREDVVRHWRRWARPEHAVMVVSGRHELGQRWASWSSATAAPAAPAMCVPHGQSTHLVASAEHSAADALVILAAAVPGLGTRERADLSGWLGWLGERPGGPIEALVGPHQARRAAPTVVDLATGPGRAFSVVIAGTRGPVEDALSDIEVVSRRFYAPVGPEEHEALRGGLVAARAEGLVLREQPVTRLVMSAEAALYETVEVTPDVNATALNARRALAPWRYTFVGLGEASLGEALAGLAPVRHWTSEGVATGGAEPRRCEPEPLP